MSAAGNPKPKAPKQWREADWPEGMYAYGHGGGYFFERRSQRVPGGRAWEPLGERLNRAIARSIEINDEIARGDYRPTTKTARKLTVGKFLEMALDTRRDHAPKTYSGYANRVAHFNTYLLERHARLTRLTDVTPEVARGYFEWRANMDVTRCGWKRPTTPTTKPSANTLETDAFRLRTLFQVAVDRGLLAQNPFAGIQSPKPNGRGRRSKQAHNPMSEEQVRRLLKAAREYDAAPRGPGASSTFRGLMYDLTRLYLLTGLRNRELIYLPWQHVDLDWPPQGIIRVEPYRLNVVLEVRPLNGQADCLSALAAERAGEERLFRSRAEMETCLPYYYTRIGSSATTYEKEESEARLRALDSVIPKAWDEAARVLRVPMTVRWKQKASAGKVPLLPEAREILSRRRKVVGDSSPFVFPHPDRGPLKSDYWAQFKTILKAAGLPAHFRVHDLRHTFGMTLRDRGVPLETIMGLMRHASIEETQRYARYSDQEGAREIIKLTGFGAIESAAARRRR